MITGKAKKFLKTKVYTGNSKKDGVSEVIIEKNKDDNLDSSVSVFTKTTNPKVVVQSEKVNDSVCLNNQNICKHRFLKSVCMVILAIILLMIFFLTLETYHTVNELYLLISN